MKLLQPPGWPRPKGYANGISARGRLIFTAGVIGWDEEERLVALNFPDQFRQVLRNTLAILAQDGAGPEHVVRMTWYMASRSDYVDCLPYIGRIWRELMGTNYPAMTVVEVSALVERGARIEIETTAVVPE